MGKGIVDSLKEDFEIEEEWLPFEIHPETPKEGMSMAERFGGASMDRMYENLKNMGRKYGIEFNKHSMLSNSYMSLAAGEYAKEKGKFHEYHERVFHAYFSECKDIGDTEVIMKIAGDIGLDREELKKKLAEGTYDNVIRETSNTAHNYGINSAPTFILDDKFAIVGAQPLESFKEALMELEGAVQM